MNTFTHEVRSTPGANAAKAAWILWIPSLLIALGGVGFVFHTSPYTTILGKYSSQHVAFLCLWYFVFVPGAFYLTRFLFTTSEFILFGRQRVLRPVVKCGAFVIFCLISHTAIETTFAKMMGERTATRAGDTFHPYLQNVPGANNARLHTNRWCFRGEDIAQAKPAGTYRIFFFGESTVLCEQIPFEDSHCRILELQLRKAYPDVSIEVQNLGAEWHTSEHSLIKYLTVAQEFSPDLIIVQHGIQDLMRSLVPDTFAGGTYQNDYRHYYGAVSNLVQPLFVMRVVEHATSGHWFSDFRFQQVRLVGPDGNGLNGMQTIFFSKAEPIEIDQWPSLVAYGRNMQDFISIAQSKGTKVVVATQPYLYREDLTQSQRESLIFPLSQQFQGKCPSLHSMMQGMEQINAESIRIAKDCGVPLIDLESIVPKTSDCIYDDVHYTRQGNKLIGEAVANFIIRSGVIPDSQLPDSPNAPEPIESRSIDHASMSK